MTKQRDPLTAFLALTRAAGALGGWDVLATFTRPRRAARTIQNWGDPGTSAGVNLDAALAIDIACVRAGDSPHLYRWYGQQLDLADAEERQARAAIAESAARAAKESGEAQAATFRAIISGDQADLLIAERETEEQFEAVAAQLHDIRAAAHPPIGSRSE